MAVGVFSLLKLGPRIQNWDPILGIGTLRLAARGAGRSCAASHGQHSAITATMPAAFATARSICPQKQNISEPMTSKPEWKHKLTERASVSRSIFAPSPNTSQSSAVIEIPRIEPLQSLGLNHNALQHLIGATFGSPSEARDLVGGP